MDNKEGINRMTLFIKRVSSVKFKEVKMNGK